MSSESLAGRLFATFLDELEEQLRVLNAELLALEGDPENADLLRGVFRVVHTLKGAARAVSQAAVEQACHALETMLAAVRTGDRHLGAREFELLFHAADALTDAGVRLRNGQGLADSPVERLAAALADEKAAAAIPSRATRATRAARATQAAAVAAPAEAPATRADSTMRVRSDKIDALFANVGTLRASTARVRGCATELQSADMTISHALASWRRTARALRRQLRSRDDAATLEALATTETQLEKVARLVSRVSADAMRGFATLEQDARVVSEQARLLRMRPCGDACEALPRVVRDVSEAGGKLVRLELTGMEVEADRAVLDGIREPLLHLVRNAVDHGLETPDVRTRRGKAREGTVRVNTRRSGDRLLVTVADDGAGLDRDRLRESLARKGTVVGPSDRDLVNALFSGGVTTRAEASAFSGRGVGLDVVRSAVSQLGGRVDVQWDEGAGTAFTLELPVTMARIRAVTAEAGGQLVAFGTAHVDRMLRVPLASLRRAGGRDVLSLPGGTAHAVVPLASLAGVLGRPFVERPASDPATVIVLRVEDARCGLLVDALCDEQELTVRGLPRTAGGARFIDGAAVLPDGRIALLADAPALVEAVLGPTAPGGTIRVTRATAARRPTVLVVDDSLTTRTLERSVLESAGYAVVTAVDGADAWRLLEDDGVDLVVTDVEMPRMDGFALCEAIRASARHRLLPVVLVTALESAEHRSRGLAAGADAYIGKASFDQRNLLAVVAQLFAAGPA